MLAKDDLQDLERLSPFYFTEAGSLVQIAFSFYQVTLRFDHLTIDAFCTGEIRCPTEKVYVWRARHINDMAGFASLLESKLEGYRITPEQELILTFSNHCELLLRNDEGAYEALVITRADGGWLVIH